jgi:hypothetical protein
MRWVGHVVCVKEMRNVYILVSKPEGKRALRRPRLRWRYNIKLDLKEIHCSNVEWILLAQDRV